MRCCANAARRREKVECPRPMARVEGVGVLVMSLEEEKQAGGRVAGEGNASRGAVQQQKVRAPAVVVVEGNGSGYTRRKAQKGSTGVEMGRGTEKGV